MRSAAGGGRSEQGLAQRSAFCENTSRKDGNRKRKRDTAHDAVGSSGAGGAIQALLRQCFFVAQNMLTLNFEVGGKA